MFYLKKLKSNDLKYKNTKVSVHLNFMTHRAKLCLLDNRFYGTGMDGHVFCTPSAYVLLKKPLLMASVNRTADRPQIPVMQL